LASAPRGGRRRVFWNVASSIVYARVITIPASAIVAALARWLALAFR
jgi:PiT family inorganic phosphate transporter